ncbi:MAG: winged helix-turn-helix domain-containing protein [candidate division WOR-3 bacterium]
MVRCVSLLEAEALILRKCKRCPLKIIADILLISRKNVKKTHIMYGANLSYALLNKYLNKISNAGLINRSPEGYYKITDKGIAFLDAYSFYIKEKGRMEKKMVALDDKKRSLQRLLNTHSQK